MKIFTKNEYSELKSMVVGNIDFANWPVGDIYFDAMMDSSTYEGTIKKGPIPKEIKDVAKKDLDVLAEKLVENNVKVFRPLKKNWELEYKKFEKITTGMHSYSARDLLLTIGNKVIECPTPYISRQHEFMAFENIKIEAIKDGCKWISAPLPAMNKEDFKIVGDKATLTEDYPIFDAANVLKFNDKLLYLVSCTGNYKGAEWLQSIVGNEFEVITWDGVYSHAHIDSTIVSLNDKTILLNGSRVNEKNIPIFLKDKKKIWINDLIPGKFYEFPYASKWIGLNIISINPETVVVDTIQKDMIEILNNEGFKVVSTPMHESRTLGGGFHCVTLDLERAED
jgi:scyllo-inosamine-4-phosphate amidinotransferase 1